MPPHFEAHFSPPLWCFDPIPGHGLTFDPIPGHGLTFDPIPGRGLSFDPIPVHGLTLMVFAITLIGYSTHGTTHLDE
jgi:hypothetical protein